MMAVWVVSGLRCPVVSNFLSVFEAKALAAALTEAGHSVSERTVQRWKAGTTKPKPQDIRAIYGVIGLAYEEAAPPEWVERLLTGVMALEAKIEVSDSELDRAEALAAAWVATAEQRRRHRQGGGGAPRATNA